jgi:hypothetical protein
MKNGEMKTKHPVLPQDLTDSESEQALANFLYYMRILKFLPLFQELSCDDPLFSTL